MGLSNKTSKKRETTQTRTNENVTTTRTNPQWVTDALQKYTGGVTGLLDRNPTDFVAPANGLQTQAASAAAGLGGAWKSGLSQAADLATQAAAARLSPTNVTAGQVRAGSVGSRDVTTGTTDRINASSLLEGLDNYLNPVLSKVVDTTLNDFDVDAGRTRAAQAAAGARAGAFGGSRFGVREAQTEGELSRARASTDANLRYQAFDTAADLSDRDAARRQAAAVANQNANIADLGRLADVDMSNADRTLTADTSNRDAILRADTSNRDATLSADTSNADRLLTANTADLDRMVDAGGLLANTANLAGANARDDVGTQMDAGSVMRDIDTETRQAPIGLLQAVGDLLGNGQFGLMNGTNVNGVTDATGTSTSTTSSSPSLISQIGQAVQIAAQAAAMSDVQLKRDIETLGYDDAGRRWVSWRYLWEPDDATPHRGVIAQEIRESDPEAVVTGPLGFLMVDYSKVESGAWRHS